MATLQHRSAFNLRGCQPIGGQALQPTESPCDGAVLDNIYEQVRQAASDYKWEAERTVVRSKLTYNCPKVGDAVRWDSKIGGFNLAYAMFDTNNPFDQEHLIEVVGIVESVSVNCDGTGSDQTTDGIETNAVIVLSGKISFDSIPDESSLTSGKVYYLWDRGAPANIAMANNVVEDIHEPTISKPLFVATGTKTAMVMNYRPLTGSPTGGRPQNETYSIDIEKTATQGGGWYITITNIGGIASRHDLVVQLDYDRRDGSDVHTMFKNIGILHTKFVADINKDDNLNYNMSFYVTKESDFGVDGGMVGNIEKGINGVGTLKVTLKSNTSGSQSSSLLKSLIPFQSADLALRFPNISVRGECGYASKEGDNVSEEDRAGTTGVSNNDLEIPDKVISPNGASTAYSFEGVIFEIKLDKDQQNEEIYIPMAEDLYFEISSPSLENPIKSKFFLNETQTAIEIIPVNEAGVGLTQENVKLRIVTADGEDLPSTHWARTIGTETHICDSERCCADGKVLIDCTIGGVTNNDAPLSDLFNNEAKDSAFMITDENGNEMSDDEKSQPKLFTLDPDRSVGIPIDAIAGNDTLMCTYKNARENTQFCYPSNIRTGTQPSFMAIYFNEARSSVLGPRNAKDYDPRYIAIEIGGQDSLNDATVTLTLNEGRVNECCIDFKFDGSVEGTHFTFRELFESGKIIKRSTNTDLLFGINQSENS